MANIVINNECNLACRYCEKQYLRNNENEEEMAFEDFVKVVNWIVYDDSENEITITGGEPLLHPLFDDFIHFLKIKGIDKAINIKTNGVLLENHIKKIARTGFNVIINLNSPEDIGKEKYEKVLENIKELRINGIPFYIGINLYDKNLNYDFLIDLVKEYSLKEVYLGLTTDYKNGDIDYIDEIEELYFSLVKDLAKEGCKSKTNCSSIPICKIQNRITELNEIQKKYGVMTQDIITCSNCEPVIEILPSLHIARCSGLMIEGLMPSIKAFKTPLDARYFFKQNFDYISRLVPMKEECNICYDKAVGYCQGGCITFKKERVLNLQLAIKQINSPAKEVVLEI